MEVAAGRRQVVWGRIIIIIIIILIKSYHNATYTPLEVTMHEAVSRRE